MIAAEEDFIMIQIEPVREYIIENFLYGDGEGLNQNTSFIQEGIVDSIGMMELTDFIESHYRINIKDHELIPQNLDSLENLEAFITQKSKPS